jgi:dihydropteroate synthase
MGNKDTSFQKTRPLRVGEKLFDFSNPLIMGILNLTPDSFFDGGRYTDAEHWVMRTRKMLDQGADIIDLGAMSTRPGADIIDESEEVRRLIEPLRLLKREFPEALFSIDTFRSGVAQQCIDEGAHMINDVSGGKMDEQMFQVVASRKIPYVLMHMEGTPKVMQQAPITDGIVSKVHAFFETRVRQLHDLGFEDIVLDPGFGFGKDLACNYALLRRLGEVRIDDLPLLVGVSRKSMINKVLNTKPGEALNGTTVIHTLALLAGANILRVHDVKEACEVVALTKQFQKNTCPD